MPQGLQAWDENGVIILDLTTKLTKILSQATASGSAGSLVDNRLTLGSGAFTIPLRSPTSSRTENYPSISISGNTISWTSGNVSVPFLYGIY